MAELNKIDAIIEEVSKSSEAFRFKFLKGEFNHFLPPFESVAAFFSVKMDAKNIYKMLHSTGDKLPTISSSSLHEIGRKGVGKTIFKKFMQLMPARLLDLMLGKLDKWLVRSFNVQSNAAQWLPGIQSFYMGMASAQGVVTPSNFYRPLSEFITLRSHQDIEFKEKLKEKVIANKIDINNDFLLWENETKPFFKKHTLISEGALNLLSQLMKDKSFLTNATNTEKEKYISYIFEIEYDFLFNCIACYETGYVGEYQESSEHIHWLISETLSAYSEPDNEVSCFRCFFNTLIQRYDENDIQINHRQIASCIPLKGYVNTDGEDKLSAQYNKLFKWYRSIDLPSSAVLSEFIINLSQLSKYSMDTTIVDVASLAIALDKAFIEKKEAIHAEFGLEIDVFIIWKKFISNYDIYYQYHRKRYLQQIGGE